MSKYTLGSRQIANGEYFSSLKPIRSTFRNDGHWGNNPLFYWNPALPIPLNPELPTLLAITGPSGAGKTAMSQHALSGMSISFLGKERKFERTRTTAIREIRKGEAPDEYIWLKNDPRVSDLILQLEQALVLITSPDEKQRITEYYAEQLRDRITYFEQHAHYGGIYGILEETLFGLLYNPNVLPYVLLDTNGVKYYRKKLAKKANLFSIGILPHDEETLETIIKGRDGSNSRLQAASEELDLMHGPEGTHVLFHNRQPMHVYEKDMEHSAFRFGAMINLIPKLPTIR